MNLNTDCRATLGRALKGMEADSVPLLQLFSLAYVVSLPEHRRRKKGGGGKSGKGGQGVGGSKERRILRS